VPSDQDYPKRDILNPDPRPAKYTLLQAIQFSLSLLHHEPIPQSKSRGSQDSPSVPAFAARLQNTFPVPERQQYWQSIQTTGSSARIAVQTRPTEYRERCQYIHQNEAGERPSEAMAHRVILGRGSAVASGRRRGRDEYGTRATLADGRFHMRRSCEWRPIA
jgi:hypothetical protein